MTIEHEHAEGFEHLDLALEGLEREYHLSWAMLPATNGPPGYKGEPYLPLAVSFGQLTGEPRRRVGHLDYALNRNFWRNIHQPTDKDRADLRRRVLEQIPEDLRKIEAGEDPPSLRTVSGDAPKFLSP